MALLESPFYVLGVTTLDGRDCIIDRAEEKYLVTEETSIRDAVAVLTNPRRRLSAEIAWLPGLDPDLASEIISEMECDPSSISPYLGQMSGLARVNLLIEALTRASRELQISEISSCILEIAYEHEKLSPDCVLFDLNNDRSKSDFPLITGTEIITAELYQRRLFFRQTIREVLTQSCLSSYIEIMTTIVETSTSHGEEHPPILIDDLVGDFEIKVNEHLVNLSVNINEQINNILDAAKNPPQSPDILSREMPTTSIKRGTANIGDLVDQLGATIWEWDAAAQPIQLSARARGSSHPMSLELATRIRNLAVVLCNDYDLIGFSKKLTNLLQDIFAEFDEIVERLEEDVAALDKISEQQARRSSELQQLQRQRHSQLMQDLAQQRQHEHPSESASTNSSWLFWCIAVIIAVVFFNAQNSTNDSTASPSKSTAPSPSVSAQSIPFSASTTSGDAIPPAQNYIPEFSMPPVGKGHTLSVAQIRWCLRQDIRLDALRPQVTTNDRVRIFNSLAADYNSRCGNFYHNRADMQRAKREVQTMRDQILSAFRPPW